MTNSDLIILDGTFFFMLCFRDSSRHIDAFELRNVVAFFVLNSAALGARILGSLTLASELSIALLTRDSLLDRPLGDLTLTLLDVSTDGIRNGSALLPGNGLKCSLGSLFANFLGNLSTI